MMTSFFQRSYFLLCTVLLFLSFQVHAQNEKEEAKNFFLSIAKIFFDKDCNKFHSLFNDSIVIVSPYGEERVSVSDVKKMWKETQQTGCEKLDRFTGGIPSYELYAKNYKLIAFSRKEFTTHNKKTEESIREYNPEQLFVYEILCEFNKYYSDDDYLVFGNRHISDDNKNIQSGLYWMIVRKTPNGWKLYGTKN